MKMTTTATPLPLQSVLDVHVPNSETDATTTTDTTNSNRWVCPHPLFPNTSIETVWERDCIVVGAVSNNTTGSTRVSFQLPPDAEQPPVYQTHWAWTSFAQAPEHLFLVVLVHPTALVIWDVYPSNNNTKNQDSWLPAEGWTVSLPFDCAGIRAVPNQGLLLQRLAEDTFYYKEPDANHDSQDQRETRTTTTEHDGFFLQSPPPHPYSNKGSTANSRHVLSPPPPHTTAVASPTVAPQQQQQQQQQPEPTTSTMPCLFSLEHPLEEVLPVCQMTTSNTNQETTAANVAVSPMTNVHETIVWVGQADWNSTTTSTDATTTTTETLLVTYHQGCHHLYAIRTAPPPPCNVPLYQRHNTQTSAESALLYHDLDLLGLATGTTTSNNNNVHTTTTKPTTAAMTAATPSRDQALAQALGVATTTTSSTQYHSNATTSSSPLHHPQTTPSFLSPNATTVLATTTATTSTTAQQHPPETTRSETAANASSSSSQILSASIGLVYLSSLSTPPTTTSTSSSSSMAQKVLVISNRAATGKCILCLLCPNDQQQQQLHFWELQSPSTQHHQHPTMAIPTTTTSPFHSLSCRDAQPIQALDGATDLLVLSGQQVVLCRAQAVVTKCVWKEKDQALAVLAMKDPVQDRISLLVQQEEQTTAKWVRARVSLRGNDFLGEHILKVTDRALDNDINSDNKTGGGLLGLSLRADVCRLVASRKLPSSFAAVQAVVSNLAAVEWYGAVSSPPSQKVVEERQPSAFDQLLASDFHRIQSAKMSTIMPSWSATTTTTTKSKKELLEETASPLREMGSLAVHVATAENVQHLMACLFDNLHLFYQDLKLGSSTERVQLGLFLVQLCRSSEDPNARQFLEHYALDFGEAICSDLPPSSGSAARTDVLSHLGSKYPEVPSVYAWCERIFREGAMQEPPFCFSKRGEKIVCPKTKTLSVIFGMLFAKESANRDRAVVEALMKEGITTETTLKEMFPPGISLPILEALHRCRNSDDAIASLPKWSPETWSLVGREDFSMNVSGDASVCTSSSFNTRLSLLSTEVDQKEFEDKDNDGLAPLELSSALLFPEDNRIHEATRLVRSSRPMFLRVARAVEVSDHDYEKLKQKKLLSLSLRAFALPVGRGMMTIGSLEPVPAEPLPVPVLSLRGRVPPTNAGITLDISDCPADMRVWPEFHNGVAAGLRLPLKGTPGESSFTISRTWIVYNKPPAFTESAEEGNNDANTELLFKNHSHAGLLLALGLRGHLTTLEMSDLYEYLTQGTVTTTVGILLGMACNKRGTCDMAVSKMLCLHIPSLIPQHFSAIDVASTVQTSAVVGAGILFQRSSHRMMTEFLLNEIGKRPDSDASAFDREAYNLACGLALGMVNLCLAEQTGGVDRAAGIADLRIEERLHKYVVGGVDAEEHGRVRETNDRFSMPTSPQNGDNNEKCSTIYEGDLINTEVTAPGATLALGLMYMRSENQTVASALALPDTHFLLEFVRPDMLTLRIISRSLILWNEVQPTIEWIEDQIPVVVSKAYAQMGEMTRKATAGSYQSKDQSEMEFDRRAVRQIYVHTLAGACFGMGLRFAGTGNQEAKKAIQYFVLELYALRESNDPVAMASKPELQILETALGCAAISLAMVMAGTGDLESLKIFKMLRWRCDQEQRYGFHMICGMAIGLLFLGGGSCTLGRAPSDIAALLTAFFPRFPTTTSDNQYHLQALRHLYAMAVKRRELRAMDVESGESVRVPVELWSNNTNDEPECITIPCLLRNSEKNRTELRVVSDDFYPLKLHLEDCMRLGTIFVKRRNVRPLQPRLLFDNVDQQQQKSLPFLSLRQLLLLPSGQTDTTLCRLLEDGLSQNHVHGLIPIFLALCRGRKDADYFWNLRLIRSYYQNHREPSSASSSMDPKALSCVQTLLSYLLETAERGLVVGPDEESTRKGLVFYDTCV